MTDARVSGCESVREMRQRIERVFTAYDEMDKLHKSMNPRDGGPPDEEKKLRVDGLCLGLADSAFVLAEACAALVERVEAAEQKVKKARAQGEKLRHITYGLHVESDERAAKWAAAEARVAALEEAAQAVVNEHMSAYKAFGSHSALGRLSSLLMTPRAALGGNPTPEKKNPEGGTMGRPGVSEWPPCLVCGAHIEGRRDDSPHYALIFTSWGNYGSRVYDTMHGPQLLVMVCDDCAVQNAERIAMRSKRVERTVWEDAGTLADDLAASPLRAPTAAEEPR